MTLLASETPACYSRTVNEWICLDYLVDRRSELTSATIEHLALTFAALAFALALALPLALLARRLPRLRSAVLGGSTALYTIPSIALFPLLVPFTGISATTVVIGLGLYALTILVRSMLDGLDAVPADVREAATGLGHSTGKRLLRVDLPLALPVMFGGLRVATVSTVALTTIGALVAHGGLGNLLADGVSTNFRSQLLAASLLCVLIAVVLDAALVGIQRALTPWTRQAAR